MHAFLGQWSHGASLWGEVLYPRILRGSKPMQIRNKPYERGIQALLKAEGQNSLNLNPLVLLLLLFLLF